MADLRKADAGTFFDPQAQAVILEAQQRVNTNNDPDSVDLVDEAAKRAAEKNLLNKLQELKKAKQGPESSVTFSRDDGVQKRWAAAMDGRLGNDVASAALGWNSNTELQGKLTSMQKRLFQEAMAQDPPRARDAAQAMQRLASDPAFPKAVTNSQQLGQVQTQLLQNPALERSVAQLLQTRFMQAPQADAATKNDFLRFGMQQMARNDAPGVKRAGDMLGVLVKTDTPRFAQRAAMNMVQRNPDNAEGVSNIDSFVQQPAVRQMPQFARGTATTLLAKADGKTEVREGFEKLATDPTFRQQSRDVQGRFFTTIGSGRVGELRAVTDKTLLALQSNQFPTRQAQVTRFLDKMGKQVGKGGADGVNVKGLLKSAKGSPLPPVPRLTSTEGLSDEETAKARAANRAKVIQYYNAVSRSYDSVDTKLEAGNAKYFEDVNILPNLRQAEALDTSGLSPEEASFVEGKSKQLQERYAGLKKLQQQRMRELRTSRISPQQRRLQARRLRAQGEQPAYFNPRAVGGKGAEIVFPRATTGAAAAPDGSGAVATSFSRASGPASPNAGVDEIMASLPASLPMQERMRRANQILAKKWQAEMNHVMQRLLAGDEPSAPLPSESEPATARGPTVQGKTDGYGIPRTFERDLGAGRLAPVRPVQAPEAQSAPVEPYAGRALVKPTATVRDPSALFDLSWKSLNKSETALMKNLGWNQQMWDTKREPAARWPQSMRTPFAKLSPTQQESVRKLGLTGPDWDAFVSHFAGPSPSTLPPGGAAPAA